jgi:hypothetical protein
MENKILISTDDLSYNNELVKLNTIAQRYLDLSKEIPKGCNGNFNDYVLNPHLYLEDFAKYCDHAIDLPIALGKKMVMINDNYMTFKNNLESLHHDMTSNLLNSKEIGKEGQITPTAKDKLKERYSTYVEGENIKLYQLMMDCQSKLNELNIALQQTNRVQIFMYSQWHSKAFKRAGSEIIFDVNAILF